MQAEAATQCIHTHTEDGKNVERLVSVAVERNRGGVDKGAVWGQLVFIKDK